MYLAKLNEMERKKLFIKIIIWSEKLSDNKVIYFYYFDLIYYFIHKTCILIMFLAI